MGGLTTGGYTVTVATGTPTGVIVLLDADAQQALDDACRRDLGQAPLGTQG